MFVLLNIIGFGVLTTNAVMGGKENFQKNWFAYGIAGLLLFEQTLYII